MSRLASILLLVVACTDAPTAGTTALFAVPGGAPGDDFYALPYPNDLRRHPDGTLDLSEFPTNSPIVESFRVAAGELDGFGLNAAMFARFDGALDPATLPDPAGSIEPTSAVYLVDVKAGSPTRGQRTPIIVKFRAAGTQTLGTNHLAVRPYPGFGLTDGTTYALVVTRRVHAADGTAVVPSSAFAALLGGGGDAAIQHAREVYAPLLTWLDEAGDDERSDVVSAAVFTTQNATAIIPAIRKGVFAAPAPTATAVVASGTNATFRTFTGSYQAPNLQMGEVPYRMPPSGQIVVAAGAATIQRMETMRFAVTIPTATMPTAGFPIAIYSHGTGGDFKSFISDGTAAALATSGIAVISTDQVLHGPRNPGGNPELDFFNFANPYAMRDNALQGAADAFSQLRLANGLSIADGGRTVTFDPTKLYFFGHSQGGLTGPGFVAFEPSLSGAVMSGTGGLLYIGLLHKTKPLDIPSLVAAFLRDEPIDEDNPSLALAQMWVERSDGGNYAPLMVRRPITTPRNIYQLEGFIDNYTPNPSIEAFATAVGGDLVQLPATQGVPGMTLRGRGVKPLPIANNVGNATAVLAQFTQQTGSDGHFVVFDLAVAKREAAEFLGTLARTGTATVVAQ